MRENKKLNPPTKITVEFQRPPLAYFPIFVKILIMLLVFGAIPLMVFSFLIIQKYDQTLNIVEQDISILGQSPNILAQYFTKLRYDMRIQVGSLLGLLFLIDVMAVFFVSRQTAKPIGALLKAMQSLGKGRYGISVKIHSRDEFSILAHFFNLMSSRLEMLRGREKWINQAKTRLLAMAAHQLRTPLTGIQWTLTEFLQGGYNHLTEKQREKIGLANKSAWRMIHLIDSLLTLTRIEAGKFGFDFKEGSIVKLIQEVAEEMKEQAAMKNIKLELNIETKLISNLYLDEGKIKFVLDNLISNAIRYTNPGGKIYVIMKERIGKRNHPEAMIMIKDTGIGMTKEETEQLFAQFYRSRGALEMYAEGAGLGLFISKNIIDNHGGEIWAESEKGKGSTFFFTLPIAIEEIPKKQEPSKQFILGE